MQAFEHRHGAVDIRLEVVEIRVRVPVFLARHFEAPISSIRLLAPFAICAVWYSAVFTRATSFATSVWSLSANGFISPAPAGSPQRIFSSRWKPVHVAAGTSPARA